VGTGCPAVTEEDVDAPEGDVARPTESATIADISAAATIGPTLRLLVEGSRRRLGQRACLVMVAEAGRFGGGGGGAPEPPELRATDGPDAALDVGRSGRASGGLGGS
jgi:hypothetical protein